MTAATSGNPLAIRKIESGRGDQYIGTAAALVAAGLAELHQFPGQPGRGKCMASYAADGAPVPKGCSLRNSPRGTHLQIARRGQSTTMFCIWIKVPEDVYNARNSRADTAASLASRDRCLALELSVLPQSAGAFRARIVAGLADCCRKLRYMMEGRGGNSGGYSFDTAAVQVFEEFMTGARVTLSRGDAAFDPARLAGEEATIRDSWGAPHPTAPPAKPRPTLRLVASNNVAMGVRGADHV